MNAYFDRFTIAMTKQESMSASHAGSCDDDVDYLSRLPKIKRQLNKIADEDLIATLKEYGAWSDVELENRQDNEKRIIWIAAGDIRESLVS